ncbi:MAG: hypothetical protein QXE05_04175 [Nitrososphaeria archaeon]
MMQKSRPKKVIEVRIIASSQKDIERIIEIIEENFRNVTASRILPNRYDEGFRCYVNITLEDDNR